MKKLVIFFTILFLISCKNTVSQPQIIVNKDTIVLSDTASLKKLENKFDSLSKKCDSLNSKLILANLTVEKVKFYVKIVKRKPSQSVFFKGWIFRAVGMDN